MRVAYICADAGVPVFGTKGCSVHVQEIIRQFLLRDCELTLFALRVGGENCLPTTRLHVRHFPLHPSDHTSARERLQMEAAIRLSSELCSQTYDLVYERYSLWSCAAQEQARRLGIPSILEDNAPLIEEQTQHRELVNHDQARAIRDQAFAAATSIVTVSASVADYVKQHLPPDQHGKVHVVPNGVDTERFHPQVQPHLAEDRFTIGFLGTIKPWHGLESLFNAFELFHREHPNAILRIIGDGPLRETLQQKLAAEQSHLAQNIQWLGAVQPRDVPGHLTALDVAVAPYPSSDNFYFSPLKVYEYLAAGRAVVASSAGQLSSIIEHGHNGLLYSPGDDRQLADCLSRLAGDPQLVQQLGQAARLSALTSHSWQCVLDKILSYVNQDHVGQALTADAKTDSMPELRFRADLNLRSHGHRVAAIREANL